MSIHRKCHVALITSMMNTNMIGVMDATLSKHAACMPPSADTFAQPRHPGVPISMGSAAASPAASSPSGFSSPPAKSAAAPATTTSTSSAGTPASSVPTSTPSAAHYATPFSLLLLTLLAAAALFTGVVGQQPEVVIFQIPSIGTCDANALVFSPSGSAGPPSDTSNSGGDGSSSGGGSSGGNNIDLINQATILADTKTQRFAQESANLGDI